METTETHVTTDRVITDPTSPEVVQIPNAGRGLLPTSRSDKRPEDVFSEPE